MTEAQLVHILGGPRDGETVGYAGDRLELASARVENPGQAKEATVHDWFTYTLRTGPTGERFYVLDGYEPWEAGSS